MVSALNGWSIRYWVRSKLRISILCSSAEHPINAHLRQWMDRYGGVHDIELVRSKRDLRGGDILFLISCVEVVKEDVTGKYNHTLVVHASDLPVGRGWSPHIWSIVAGGTEIVVSLLEAAEPVDSGAIWLKVRIDVPVTALYDEINHLLFGAELELMDFAVKNAQAIVPSPQDPTVEPTYFARRTPEDSRVDPHASIASQFDLIRVCDPNRFPAYFELHGQRFLLKLEKSDDS